MRTLIIIRGNNWKIYIIYMRLPVAAKAVDWDGLNFSAGRAMSPIPAITRA